MKRNSIEASVFKGSSYIKKINKMETKKVIDLKKGDVIETLFNLKEVKEVKKDEDDLKDTWITIFFTDGSKYHCLTDELISLFC